MKPPQLGSTTEVAHVASGAQPSIGIQPRLRPLQPLFRQLAAAARRDDRAEFDRLFEGCFGRVYAVAWRVTGDHAQAEAVTEHILYEAMIAAG